MLEVIWDSVVDDRHSELLFGPFHAVVQPPVSSLKRAERARQSQETLAKALRNGPGTLSQLVDRSGLSRERTWSALWTMQQRGQVVAGGRRKQYVYRLAEA